MIPILIAAFVALVLVQTVLLSKLAEHRTDIGRREHPGAGPSWSWQMNVLRHARYDAKGQRVKRWVLAVTGVQLLVLAAAVILQ